MACIPLWSQELLPIGRGQLSISSTYAKLSVPIAGVAGGQDVVFVGEPLNASVIALSRLTGKQIGQLPPPPNGFAIPPIVHSLGEGRLAVLDVGGIPQPNPFVPANPSLYEYTYNFSPFHGFSATLVRAISFASVLIG